MKKPRKKKLSNGLSPTCLSTPTEKKGKVFPSNNKAKGEEQEIDWDKQLTKLIKWSNNKGYSVVFKKTEQDWVDLDKKEIVISSSHGDEVALYCLLHELGHIILIKDKRRYKHAYGIIWDSFSENSLTLRVTTLQEELDAWREGLKLAKSLKMKVQRRKYEIIKAKCIATYLPWASRKTALCEID